MSAEDCYTLCLLGKGLKFLFKAAWFLIATPFRAGKWIYNKCTEKVDTRNETAYFCDRSSIADDRSNDRSFEQQVSKARQTSLSKNAEQLKSIKPMELSRMSV
ncbi:hypothetical protein [Enterococcus ratti]|uniref:hypothetical protein n=1 Tax=Enterococcus ratti TaxID=150033 RepID=UPI0008FFEB50|nr:hypothetical protein [Enterococcus ratti]